MPHVAPWSLPLSQIGENYDENVRCARDALRALLDGYPEAAASIYWVHVQIDEPEPDADQASRDSGQSALTIRGLSVTWRTSAENLSEEESETFKHLLNELRWMDVSGAGVAELLIRAGEAGDECLSISRNQIQRLESRATDSGWQYARVGHPQEDTLFHAGQIARSCLWVVCRDWLAIRECLLLPVRAFVMEAFGALQRELVRRQSEEIRRLEKRISSDEDASEAAVKLLDIWNEAVPHVRILYRTKRVHWKHIEEHYRLTEDPVLIPAIDAPDPRRKGNEQFRHRWPDKPTPEMLISLRWQVASILCWYLGKELNMSGPDHNIKLLEKSAEFRDKIRATFAMLDPCFGRILEEPEDSDSHVAAFNFLKACFHSSFDDLNYRGGLRYSLLALWGIDNGLPVDQVRELAPRYLKPSGLPKEVLVALAGLAFEKPPSSMNVTRIVEDKAEIQILFPFSAGGVAAAESYCEGRVGRDDRTRHSLETVMEVVRAQKEAKAIRLRYLETGLEVILGP